MNVVDSSAWLSYFASDGNSEVFAEPIEKLPALLVPSITITEVFKNVLRQRGEEAALIVTAHMKQGKVIPMNTGSTNNRDKRRDGQMKRENVRDRRTKN